MKPSATWLFLAIATAACATHNDDDTVAEIRARAERVCAPTLSPSKSQTAALALSPSQEQIPAARTGLLLAADQASSDAFIVELQTGTITRVPIGAVEAHEVAISPNGRWGVVTDYGKRLRGTEAFNGNTIAVINMRTKRLERKISLGEHRGAHGVAFLSRSDSLVAVTTQSTNDIVIVDIVSGIVQSAIATHGNQSHLLAVAPNGKSVFTVNEKDGTVSHIDLASQAFVRSIAVGTPPSEGLAIDALGRELWIGSKSGGLVRVMNIDRGTIEATIENFATPDRIAMSQDGSRVVISDWRCNALHVVDAASRTVERVLRDISGGVSIAPDNRVAFVTAEQQRAVVVLDLETGLVLARYQMQRTPDGVAWGPVPEP